MRWFLSSEFAHKSVALIAILKLRVQYQVGQYLTIFFNFNLKFIWKFLYRNKSFLSQSSNKTFKLTMRKFVKNLPSVNCTIGVMDCYTIFNSADIVTRVSLR